MSNCTDFILYVAYCRLSSPEFERMLEILRAWGNGVISPNFATYEILRIAEAETGIRALFEAYFDMMDAPYDSRCSSIFNAATSEYRNGLHFQSGSAANS